MMKPFPHSYKVTATAEEQSHIELSSSGLRSLTSEAPSEFGGVGGFWSPETMTVAAVADCFVLTFRAIALVSNLRWTKLVCDAEGTLNRSDGVTRFTEIQLNAHLKVPVGTDIEKARRVLEKTEKNCVIGNSLKVNPIVQTDIEPVNSPYMSGAA
jgi:organic hydroperoxide reductase OsmC/OhrA